MPLTSFSKQIPIRYYLQTALKVCDSRIAKPHERCRRESFLSTAWLINHHVFPGDLQAGCRRTRRMMKLLSISANPLPHVIFPPSLMLLNLPGVSPPLATFTRKAFFVTPAAARTGLTASGQGKATSPSRCNRHGIWFGGRDSNRDRSARRRAGSTLQMDHLEEVGNAVVLLRLSFQLL